MDRVGEERARRGISIIGGAIWRVVFIKYPYQFADKLHNDKFASWFNANKSDFNIMHVAVRRSDQPRWCRSSSPSIYWQFLLLNNFIIHLSSARRKDNCLPPSPEPFFMSPLPSPYPISCATHNTYLRAPIKPACTAGSAKCVNLLQMKNCARCLGAVKIAIYIAGDYRKHSLNGL